VPLRLPTLALLHCREAVASKKGSPLRWRLTPRRGPEAGPAAKQRVLFGGKGQQGSGSAGEEEEGQQEGGLWGSEEQRQRHVAEGRGVASSPEGEGDVTAMVRMGTAPRGQGEK
jgi:hypothetical protein